MHNTPENQAAIAAGISASIVAARAVGKPDPSDDDLRFDLALSGFPGTPQVAAFQRAKEIALAAIEAAAATLSLALVVGALLAWCLALGGTA